MRSLQMYAAFVSVACSSAFLISYPQHGHRLSTDASIIISTGHKSANIRNDEVPESNNEAKKLGIARRDILSSSLIAGGFWMYLAAPVSCAAEETMDESFTSLAARANQMSKEMNLIQPLKTSSMILASNKTAYDFVLPVAGVDIKIQDLIRQEFNDKDAELLGTVGQTYRDAKVKAILVVNIKQDDVVARRTIPELISLASKYGRGTEGALAIIACPTDQGYYEPDTSQLLRLKLASEYGYGINPSTIVTDKVNMLGTGAHPFWRWLQNTCRTPAGLGRLQGNFEKFLIDGRTGLPLRRYPRRYQPLNIADDIEAVLAGRPLPPAGANYLEEWRNAAAEAERDTYRFEKGLNVFDQ